MTKPFWGHVWSDDIGSQDVHDNIELGGTKVKSHHVTPSKILGGKKVKSVHVMSSKIQPAERKRRRWRCWTWPGLPLPVEHPVTSPLEKRRKDIEIFQAKVLYLGLRRRLRYWPSPCSGWWWKLCLTHTWGSRRNPCQCTNWKRNHCFKDGWRY